MKILFLHGWHSVPGGVKPTYLKDHGHEVINPALDDEDFEAAVATAQAEFDTHQPDVIVGSSRGGALALNINSNDTPLVLICPAWKRWGTVKKLKPKSVILHSRKDDVIPYEESEDLVARSSLSPETLMEVGSDHRLADDSSLAVMLWACELMASHEQLPWLEESSQDEWMTPEDARYVCGGCGEKIAIPVDLIQGSHPSYTECCPVCCRANTIHVEMDEAGEVRVRAECDLDLELSRVFEIVPPITQFQIHQLAGEIQPPDSVQQRVLLDDDHTKVILFTFATGHGLTEHAAPFPAFLQIITGLAMLTVGDKLVAGKPGTWIQMAAKTPHSIKAKTPVVMLLTLLKIPA